MGVAGTGKSTLCKEILRRIHAVYLDNNYIADEFFPHTRTGQSYNRLRPQLYSALYTIAVENLKIGNSVLLDSPHIKQVQTRSWRMLIKRLVNSANARLVIIRCFCSEKTLRERICQRGERRDVWKLKHWRKFLTQEPLDAPISFPHLDINTESPIAKYLPLVVDYILNPGARTSVSRHQVPGLSR